MREATLAAVVMDGRGGRLKEVARRLVERPAVVLQLCRCEVFGGGWHSGTAGTLRAPRAKYLAVAASYCCEEPRGWQVAVLALWPSSGPETRQRTRPHAAHVPGRYLCVQACTWAAGTLLLWRGLIIRSATDVADEPPGAKLF